MGAPAVLGCLVWVPASSDCPNVTLVKSSVTLLACDVFTIANEANQGQCSRIY
jgi:hypothetical protein